MRLPPQTLLPTPPASSVGAFFVAVRLRHNSGAINVSVTSHPSRLQWPWSGFTPGNTIAHIRDFSITDETVPEAERGTYLAFTRDSAGTAQLTQLAKAGINTVHLLPSFDIATIEAAVRGEPVV